MTTKRLMLTVGLPGSGKSTALVDLCGDDNMSIVSPDHHAWVDGVFHPEKLGEAWRKANAALIEYVRLGVLLVGFDATLINPEDRGMLVALGRAFGYEVTALWMDTPLATCLHRNADRRRQVPERVMAKMAVDFVPPCFWDVEEFDVVLRCRPGSRVEIRGEDREKLVKR